MALHLLSMRMNILLGNKSGVLLGEEARGGVRLATTGFGFRNDLDNISGHR